MPIIPFGFGQINWVFGGTACPNGAEVTMGFERSGTDPVATLAAAAYDAWADNMLANQSSAVVLRSAVVKLGPSSTGATGVHTGSATGAESAAATPPQVAVLCRKITAVGGRKGRGRFYMPGPPEGSIDADGGIGSTYFGEVNTGLDDFWDQLVASALSPVLLHSASGDPTDVTSFSASSLVATQRRRLRP